MKMYYRYQEDWPTEEGTMPIRCERWVVYKETPKGVWLVPYHSMGLLPPVETRMSVWKFISGARWVGTDPGKVHWCYPTVTQAWESYLHRKEWHVRYAKRMLHRAELALRAAQKMQAPTKEVTYFRG